MDASDAFYHTSSPESVDNWVSRVKPSSKHTELGPWLLVSSKKLEEVDVDEKAGDRSDEFATEATPLEVQLRQEVRRIEDDPNIPVRVSKKAPKNKKILREEEYTKFNAAIKALAIKYKFLSGKWLYMPSPEHCDELWKKLCVNFALGPQDPKSIASKGVNTMKISTAPNPGQENWVICVYCPDSYNEDNVKEVLKLLISQIRTKPISYKSDTFTHLGIDSHHESKIPSSLYKVAEMLTKEQIDALYAENAPPPVVVPTKKITEEERAAANAEFDPVSDSSDEDDEPKQKKAKTSK